MNIFRSIFTALGGEALNALEAKSLIDDRSVFILDVRQANEFKSGHIGGSKHIPLDQLGRRINELPKDRDILCVCRTGARSGVAVRQLKSAGLNAINLRGGIMGWQHAGYSVKKGK